jgi:hypothetical protein
MKRAIASLCVVLVACVFMGGCAKSRCADICVWLDDCYSVDEDDCNDTCNDAADSEGDSCGDAIKDFASCVNDNGGCTTGTIECDAEYVDFSAECEIIFY